MTATQRAIIISLFIMSTSFGITMLNELNIAYEAETGQKLIRKEITTFIEYDEVGVSHDDTEYNQTLNDVAEFNKPDNIAFDFSFWQSIKIFKIIANAFIYSVYGFPNFLHTEFGMPELLVIPMLILINLCHLLFAIYVILGKSF